MNNKIKVVLISVVLIPILSAKVTVPQYHGSSIESVWNQVTSDEYKLPQNKVSFSSLFGWGVNKIKNAANRTLADRSDVIRQFDKLAHPNGVCLKGEWNITEDNRYSGYFKKGSKALIVARASTALSDTKKGQLRGFGLAGKLFPTSDESQIVKTANFFVVDDLGGTKAEHYTDVKLINEPAASKTAAVLLKLTYALKLAVTFGKADSNPGIRQLYEISELGQSSAETIVTPRYFAIHAKSGQSVDEADFRDELNVRNYDNDQIIFNISVAADKDSEGNPKFETIGTITFNQSSVSNSCDHRLHFHHPKWRSDLTH